jgi:RNA polymerase sigma factor (sigma-70 family)
MAGHSLARRNRLVEANLDLVEPIARMVARRAPASIELADLVQAGMVGLVQAAGSFERGRAPFRLFARARVRGAMLDSIRRRNWIHAQHAEVPVEIRDGRAAADELAERAERVTRVRAALRTLPTQEARVIGGILDGDSLKLAAAELAISGPRASELKAQGIGRLKKLFR